MSITLTSKMQFSLALVWILVWANACGGSRSLETKSALEKEGPVSAPEISEDTSQGAIQYLEAKVKKNPDDFIAYNKLVGYYLRRQRETGNSSYIELALRASKASLAALPAEQNPWGLAGLAQSELTSHQFTSARDHSMQLTKLLPRESFGYQLLGDAHIELGEYEKAAEAYAAMERHQETPAVASEARLGQFAMLRGDTETAVRRFQAALKLAENARVRERETIAWCHWKLGEIAFARGKYDAAEAHYRDSIASFPEYHQGLFSLGLALAARGDFAGAIAQCERVAKMLPDPDHVAALGDLYKATGREQEAEQQYRLIESMSGLDETDGPPNRHLIHFYADHDLKLDKAYAAAVRDFETRRDIYGADAVAWTALKTGRVDEARRMIKEALRLSTRDARLFFHAGMIALAAGDKSEARNQLRAALDLNPHFDILQTETARKALAELSK
jgi:tetratricopeptide (TPR) repeat protein